MLATLSNAEKIDLGLIGVFFVLFPVLVNGLIAFAVGGAIAEKRANDRYLDAAAFRMALEGEAAYLAAVASNEASRARVLARLAGCCGRPCMAGLS